MKKIIDAKVEKINIDYQGKIVNAQKLTISSEISINIDKAWEKLQTSALLEFVTKGKVTFKPINGHFPITWSQSSTVSTKMFIYGIIPFGGTHTLFFEKVDSINKILQTKEWDNAAKIWNHTISLKKLNDNAINYTDEIVIYGGFLTAFIVAWAKSFYIHRQKRWHFVAANNIQFQ